MTAATLLSRYLAPSLLGFSAVLAAANWYLAPARTTAWATTLVTLVCMAMVLWFFALRRSPDSPVKQREADAIRNAVAFASLTLAIPLAGKLLHALGAADSDNVDLSQRMTMVMLGVFFAFTGNALPKMLTPLSALHCDGAKMQAWQRFTGWTSVLAGVAFAVVWLVLPRASAMLLSVALMIGAGLAVTIQAGRLRRAPRAGAGRASGPPPI